MQLTKTKIAEWGLVLVITALAAGITLTLVRYFAPGLLGIHSDLQLVQVDKKIPPFFEGALRSEDSFVQDVTTADPITKVRGRPFLPNIGSMGPNDLLGFRNRAIPARADIVTIGDSQTYGNNAPIDSNWPGHLANALGAYNPAIYNMSTGGWGPVQYYYAFQKALFFRPRIIIVAFYTGNDAPDAFQMAYGSPEWSQFKTDTTLSMSDMPKIIFPPEPEDKLPIRIKTGVSTILTPKYRSSCVKDNPAINAGYQIMAHVVKEMAAVANEEHIDLIVTIIPTKEFVYRRVISDQLTSTNEDYEQLIKDETKRIAEFEAAVSKIGGVQYISVEKPLTNAAANDLEPLYPDNENGHPLSGGYQIIANALANNVEAAYLNNFSGQVAISTSNKAQTMLLIDNKHFVEVDHVNPITKDGHPNFDIPVWTKFPDSISRLGSVKDERFKDINLDNYRDKISHTLNQPNAQL